MSETASFLQNLKESLPPLYQALLLLGIGYGSARLFKNASHWTRRLGVFVYAPFVMMGFFMVKVYAIDKDVWSAVALLAFIFGFIQRGQE